MHPDCPLCVDLDGTLIAHETHQVAFWALLTKQPCLVLGFGWRWLRRGKLAAKTFAAYHAFIKKEALFGRQALTKRILKPRPDLLTWLLSEKGQGRTLVLITGAPCVLRPVLRKAYPLFDVIVTSGVRDNRVGAKKAKWLVAHYGVQGFDYVGNSWKDLFVWRLARRAHVVTKSSLVRCLARLLLRNQSKTPAQEAKRV